MIRLEALDRFAGGDSIPAVPTPSLPRPVRHLIVVTAFRRRIGLVLLLALLASLVSLVPAQAECAGNHIRIRFTGFDPEGSTRFAYIIEEPGDPGSSQSKVFTIIAGGDSCGESVSVDYGTSGGTASPNVDYQPLGPRSAPMVVPLHDEERKEDAVAIYGDGVGVGDAHVESVGLVLSNPFNAALGHPSAAPILIVDDDGANRVGFESAPYSQSGSENVAQARIPVFRAGQPEATPVSVNWSISPGGASPGAPGQDVSPTSGTVTFGSNDRAGAIDLSIADDQLAEGPETFTISLSGGAIVAGQMTFTIEDNEESARPTSRLHHPRHGWRYQKGDYRIREIHIFASDSGGPNAIASGVSTAQLALRKNLKNGRCLWWSGGGGWQQKDCQNEGWLATQYDPVGELYRYRMKQLRSSVRTNIKNYTAFSRAIDRAGNVEGDFAEKRNANTFEIKRRRRR